MVLTRRQFARARRWLPLWGLLMVLMSFGSQAATDLCTLTALRQLHLGPRHDGARQRQPDGRKT